MSWIQLVCGFLMLTILLHLSDKLTAIDYTAAYCYMTTSNDITGHC